MVIIVLGHDVWPMACLAHDTYGPWHLWPMVSLIYYHKSSTWSYKKTARIMLTDCYVHL